VNELEETAGPLIFACCGHCAHAEHFDNAHDMPCDHGCNDPVTDDD
jgi:hypothetical protein